MNKLSALGILVVVVLAIAAAAFLVVERQEASMRPAAATSTATTTPAYTQLFTQTEEGNSAFASALTSEDKGDYASALSELQSALSAASDPLQKQLIQLRIAEDESFTQNYQNAAQQFLTIAGNTSDLPVIRAYAVEGVGLIYSRTQDPAVTSQIFSQQPYKALYVATSTNVSYRDLFEYATTLTPLPVSEYSIASSYAYGITRHGQTSSSTAAASIVQELNASFQAGDAALLILQKNASSSAYTLQAEQMRAVALGEMQLIGDTGLGDPVQAYETVLSAYDTGGMSSMDGTARLDYAEFLAYAYGAARLSDIQSTLAPIYTNTSAGGALTDAYLKGFVGKSLTLPKRNLITLASLDPQFKTFLVSLGWTNADFSTGTSAAQ